MSGKPKSPQTTLYLNEEERAKLKEIAKAKGYVVKRGPYVGEGSVGKLMQALARGELIVIDPRGSEEVFRALCDSENQPHQWMGYFDELGREMSSFQKELMGVGGVNVE